MYVYISLLFISLLSTILIPYFGIYGIFVCVLVLCVVQGVRKIMGNQRVFFFIAGGRLIFFATVRRYGFLEKSSLLGCGQSRQEIDIHIPTPLIGLVTDERYKGYIVSTKHSGDYLVYAPGYAPLIVGSSVQLSGRGVCLDPKTPFSFHRQLFSQGIISILHQPTVYHHDVGVARNSTVARVFPQQMLGIPEGLLWGDISYMPPDIYLSFVESGLVYLIAASGGNISTLVFFVSLIMIRITKKRRERWQAVAAGLYCVMLSANCALRRAGIGYLASVVCRIRGRQMSSWSIVLISLIVISLFDPYQITTSWGVLLSVGGVLGILSLPRRSRYVGVQAILISLFAFFGVSGPLLFLVQSVQIITPLLSFPAQVLASVILVLSLISCIPYAGTVVAPLMLYLIKILVGLSQWGSDHGYVISVLHPFVGWIRWGLTWLLLLSISYGVRVYRLSKRD